MAALSSDRDQPIEIEADYAQLDDVAGVTVYKGDVVIVQGSMRMTGDLLTVHYDAGRRLEQARMDGQPATFRQRPDGAAVDDEGEALHIEYFAAKDLLVLQEQARLRQGERRFSGAEITYDTVRSLIKAYGEAPAGEKAGGSGEGGGRVRIVLPPPSPAGSP